MKTINSKITPNQDQESYYQQLYYKEPEEEFLPSKKITKWNDKPFQSDTHLFMDSDKDAIQEDLFETLNINTQVRRYDKNKKLIWVTKPNHKFEEEIEARLKEARPITWSQELDPSSQVDQRCRREFERMIVEDCTFTMGEIKVPQLTTPGDVKTSHHLRIEEMAKFMKITTKQAEKLARIYRILGIDFKMAVYKKITRPYSKKKQSLNMHIKDFVKNTKKSPWEIKLTETHRLIDYADELLAIENTQQEDPTWKDEDHFKIEVKYAHMKHPGDGDEYSIKTLDEDKPDYDNDNNVGLYTYQNMSKIPDNPQFLGRHGRRFMRLLEKADKLTKEGIKTATNWVKKQKKEGIQGKEYNKIYYKRIEIWEKKVRELQIQRVAS